MTQADLSRYSPNPVPGGLLRASASAPRARARRARAPSTRVQRRRSGRAVKGVGKSCCRLTRIVPLKAARLSLLTSLAHERRRASRAGCANAGACVALGARVPGPNASCRIEQAF